jgi:hypothetical protein
MRTKRLACNIFYFLLHQVHMIPYTILRYKTHFIKHKRIFLWGDNIIILPLSEHISPVV